MCGQLIPRSEAKRVYIEGALITVCLKCYNKMSKKGIKEVTKEITKPSRIRGIIKPRAVRRPRRTIYEEYEVVSDYAERIRKAREAMGWSHKVLAEKVKESENIIKRIESGKLIPDIELARKLERVLKIKLLEPIVEETEFYTPPSKVKTTELTLGDVVSIRKKKK